MYTLKDGVLTIDEGVTEISRKDFSFDKKDIKSVIIPDGVKKIGASAFSYCANLTTVTMLEGVEKIEDEAFRYCKNLTTIIIPESIKDIGNYSFENCGIDNFEGKNFKIKNGLALSSDGFTVLYRANANLTAITIPEGVKKIERFAFSRCENLTKVTIPDGVEEIGDCAFHCCSIDNLESKVLKIKNG